MCISTLKPPDKSKSINKERKRTPLIYAWACHPHAFLYITLVQLERLLEHARELAHLTFESLLVCPGQTRVEQFTRNALHIGRNLESKGTECLVLASEKLPGVHGIDDAAGVLEWAALARAELATCPASVDQPAGYVVFGHAIGEHFCVASRLVQGGLVQSFWRGEGNVRVTR